MTRPVAPGAASPAVSLDERRREHRHPTRHRLFLRTNGAPRGRVWLVDLSSHGCCVQADGLDLRPSQALTLHRGAGVEYLASGHGALVRWVHEDQAGLEFVKAIGASDTLWQGLIAECDTR
ncbi:PilZ domain-containing protein [Novosphingobium profundi]|uniref:PilZ domain-containing protein n=1 Tax=Novosphingobium profundi TaxID=1774954 RepID=UPI001BDA318D|nr:PilZ domain-containing protein [Novosphingobium profundi]MBT0668068.1 PilZ domain-containing protein [Novosphingobium profundi]